MKTILIYADGACSGNPGPGGWASVIALPEGKIKELGGAARATTNNRMELCAVIETLKFLKNRNEVLVFCVDSNYVLQGMSQWVKIWRARGWKKADGGEVANEDLWREAAELLEARPKDTLEWLHVKGHSGVAGNERADQIAVAFSLGEDFALYEGNAQNYSYGPIERPPFRAVGSSGSKPKAKVEAGYPVYLVYIGGKLSRYATWKECEAQVKGRAGVKFKKVSNRAEEEEWVRGNS